MRNLKKVIALVAVFAMMVSTVAFAQTFTDVDEAHDYYEAIEMLSSLNILTGDDQDGDGKMDFRPNDTITRAEVAAVISRIQNITSAAQTATEFVDVPASHWASGYIAQAAGQGIVNGYGDGNFGPDDKVLYEQVVKMLVETLGYGPYVADNGGYPTGHLTAASRYGILEGVVGGAQGAEANRGMVAQMVYNAIDTPLMDRWTYGADAEYVIYNGKGDYDYVTLLSRDLGVKKFSGIVESNQVTDLDSYNQIDTDEEAEISFIYDGIGYDSDENAYIIADSDYDLYECDEITTIYEGESEAGKLIGYHVNAYVRETGRNGEYEVISIAQSNKNKVVEFTLDQFESANDSYIKYYKNESDRSTTNIKLDANGYALLYNGVAAAETDVDINDYVEANSKYSGKVTLVDNNASSGYDVVFVDIASTAVVDEVTAAGRVVFKRTPSNSDGQTIELFFDEEDNETIIELTKDGAPVEYTELVEWDVLSILYNGQNEYYVAEVLDSTAIEGSVSGRSISKTSACKDGDDYYKLNINGTYYDVAEGFYSNSSKISVGASGVFYIDAYGKIVAYDKNGATTASDAYAYVLATSAMPDEWDNYNIRALILDKSGQVYDASLASSIKIENAPAKFTAVAGADKTSYKLQDLSAKKAEGSTKNAVDILAEEMLNELITYEANSQGEIKTITFAQNTDEEDGTLYLADYDDKASYDEEDMELTVGSKYDITEETLVFFINGDGEKVNGLEETDAASKTASKVGGVANLATNSGLIAAVYDVDNDVPAVVVLWNTTGGISPASNIAVIDEIGSAYVDGDDVTSVTYFHAGEKKTATVSADLEGDALDAIEKAAQGDLFKFSLAGDIIVDVDKYADFENRTANKWGADGAPTVTFKKDKGADEEFYFGPVVDYSGANKRIKIAALDNLLSTTNVNATGAFVYVYDPIRKTNKITVGDAADVSYDDSLIENLEEDNYPIVSKETKKQIVAAGELPLGMLDYVAAVEYDGDVLDVVIYKAYDFGRWNFDKEAK